jgi:hypothetical protein
MFSKKTRREATEGEVLYRWLQGVRAKALTPFFFEHKLVSNQFMFRREAPSGSYYPIADKNRNMKCPILHRFAQIKCNCYPNTCKHCKSDGIIFP